MSEVINNREYRQKVLKEIILELHGGKSVEEVKARFEELIRGVSAAEIAEMEQALIREGMEVREIQNLCDVHAAVFKGSIEEIHRENKPEETPGHPVHTFKLENRAIEKLIRETITPLLARLKAGGDGESTAALASALETLSAVDRHYARKENLLFPFMEKYGITAPPKVMWGVDDEIRAALKEALALAKAGPGAAQQAAAKAEEAVTKATEMIFKEENILFPMVLETLSEDEWLQIRDDSAELGFCLAEPGSQWKPARENVEGKLQSQGEAPSGGGYIRFEPGILSPEEIKWIFNTLPVDITFVDKDGAVKYFSQGKERVFARPASVIGRQVANCHPPASIHIVEKIVEDLKSGQKEHEDFWIKMGEQLVYIRYFAVRNDKGEFLGIMEVTQNIKPLQDITGEKRLMSE
ncbi:hypothetical protein SAMN02745823_03558 [Sporobacter termitidis DSM 10068]|uniref:PAC domain-containing protein n=1 Tax=Sporobacter termitidis DSM 10068 TaxID=1123282 RepID=A0A1M5ZD94_9FIRM|nr:DUF438 domain-containing protein [Sporobacter termitidis]SHI22154.1 hypothetical protein SAMN02745823_03558 [Sporobacter termitidis DSM 10068]